MDQRLRDEVAQLQAHICEGLADSNRILILYVLSERPTRVTELATSLDLPQPTVSRHLKILRDRSLVVGQRTGQGIAYTLVDQRVIEALDLLRSVLNDQLTAQASLAQRALGQTVTLEKE